MEYFLPALRISGPPDVPEIIKMGLDLHRGEVRDNLAAGVVEPAISKIKSLRFAVEAAISVLRIDDLVKLNPPREQQQQQQGGRR